MRKSIIRENEVDTVYLLAKELAYDVVTGQTDKLTAALAKTSGKDIVQFANAVKITNSTIDGKVCTGTHAKVSGAHSSITDYAVDAKGGKTAQCSGFSADQKDKPFSKFAEVLELRDEKNWPTGQYATDGSSGVKGGELNSNAKAVAKDLVALNRDEKP